MEMRMWIKVLFIVQILQDLLECSVHASDCPDPNQYPMKIGGRCCLKCREGQKVKEHCVAGKPNSTQCEDCEEGSYQSLRSGEENCRPCDRQAKSNVVILQNCTRTHDIKYGFCVKGFFKNEGLDDCMRCRSCSKGFGVKEECKESSDTKCMKEECVVGTFSDKRSSTQRCRQCTYCNDDEEIVKSCSAMTNSICRKKRIGSNQSTRVPVLDKVATPTIEFESTAANRSSDTGWVMPFFVSAMVLLIVLFFGFVVGVSLWCHRNSRRQLSGVIQGESPRVAKRHDETQTVLLPNRDELHLAKEEYNNGMLIRHVSHDVIEQLAMYLNPSNHPMNWKKVACLLGFELSYINNLALLPRSATQEMLERWGTKKDSTVYKLYAILKEIDRDDAADVLKQLLIEPPPVYPKTV